MHFTNLISTLALSATLLTTNIIANPIPAAIHSNATDISPPSISIPTRVHTSLHPRETDPHLKDLIQKIMSFRPAIGGLPTFLKFHGDMDTMCFHPLDDPVRNPDGNFDLCFKDTICWFRWHQEYVRYLKSCDTAPWDVDAVNEFQRCAEEKVLAKDAPMVARHCGLESIADDGVQVKDPQFWSSD